MGRKLHTEHEMHSLGSNVDNTPALRGITNEKNKYLYMCGIIKKIPGIMWLVFCTMAGLWVYLFNRDEIISRASCSLGHNSGYN